MIRPSLALLAAAALSTMASSAELTPGQLAITGFWQSKQPESGGVQRVRNRETGARIDAAKAHQLPWAAAVRARAEANIIAGKIPESPAIHCYPAELPGATWSGSLFRIGYLVEPNQVTYLGEVHRVMRIAYMNQQHPADLKPSWHGHSVARWEGDTLVIDSTGFDDRNIIELGLPITGRMHIVQRLQVVGDELQSEVTFDDPGTFTAPFTVKDSYRRTELPPQEYICQENNPEGGMPDSSGGTTRGLTLGASKD